MPIRINLPRACIAVVISALSGTAVFSDTVKIYDLSLSGQVHRSGFHGLAGEVSSPSPIDGYKVLAKGKLTLGENIMVTGSVRTTGIFILQLPSTQDRQWSVSVLDGDTVVAGPVSIEITKPGIGLDWNLSSKPSDTAGRLDIERDAKLNRQVAREIVKATPSFLLNTAATREAKTQMPRPPSIKILEPGILEPKRLARDIDRLEDERLIGLAEKLQDKEWTDRFIQKIGKPIQNTIINATNSAFGDESVDLRMSWKDEKNPGFLFMRVAKLDEATIKAGVRLRDDSRSVPPLRTERISGYNGLYSTWGSNSGVLVLWNDYHITINLASSDASLITPESLTGFLALILEGM